jgi:hypothetical protein
MKSKAIQVAVSKLYKTDSAAAKAVAELVAGIVMDNVNVPDDKVKALILIEMNELGRSAQIINAACGFTGRAR